MTEPKDPVESVNDGLELLERHISILRTVRDNQPVGLIRLSEMTGIPKHRVRYSLKIMETTRSWPPWPNPWRGWPRRCAF